MIILKFMEKLYNKFYKKNKKGAIMEKIGIKGYFSTQLIRDGKVIQQFSDKNIVLDSLEDLFYTQLSTNRPFTIEHIGLYTSSEVANMQEEDFGSFLVTNHIFPFTQRTIEYINDRREVVFKWEINGSDILSVMTPSEGENFIKLQRFNLVATEFDEDSVVSVMENYSTSTNVSYRNVTVKEIVDSNHYIQVRDSDKLIGSWRLSLSIN